jgi:hypothetical protein
MSSDSGSAPESSTETHRPSAGGDGPFEQHRRPAGVSTATVEAVGKVTEALETVERARGQLYAFHQLTGEADLKLDEAVEKLREAGHGELAETISRDLIGRNVISGRWTFQLLEEYDAVYFRTFQDLERRTRDDLLAGRRHVYEAEMKEDRRTHGLPGHEARPAVEVPQSSSD